MSEEDLHNRITSGGFLPLALSLEPLQKILVDLMNLIEKHSSEIKDIRDQMPSRNELDQMKEALDNAIKDTDSKLEKMKNDITDNTNDLKELIEKNNNTMNEKMNEFDANNGRQLQAENENSEKINDIDQKINDILDQLNQQSNALQQNAEKINKLDEVTKCIEDSNRSVQEKDAQLDPQGTTSNGHASGENANSSTDYSDRFDDLMNRVKALENANNATSDLQSALESKDGQVDIQPIIKSIAALTSRVDALENTLANSRDSPNRGGDSTQNIYTDLNGSNQHQTDSNSLKSDLNPNANSSENGESSKSNSNTTDGSTTDVHQNGVHPPNGESQGRTSGRNSRSSNKGFAPPLPDLLSSDNREALEQLRQSLTGLEARLTKNENTDERDHTAFLSNISALQEAVNDRPSGQQFENLFNKFRDSLNNLTNMVSAMAADHENFARIDDLKNLQTNVKKMLNDSDEASACRKTVKCLFCGQGKKVVSGSIQDDETMSILGAAPISHVTNENKPCFVYGSDHELYYSSSPSGKTYVASPRRSTAQSPTLTPHKE